MSEILVSIGKFSVYTHSLLVVIGFFWYGFVLYKKGLEYRYERESLLDLAVMSAIFGWIFARIAFVIFNLSTFQLNWLRVVLLTDYPGYDYLGLLVGLVVAVVVLSRRGEIKLFEGLDLLGLALPGAICFERLGKVLSGEGRLVFGLPVEILQTFLFLLIFVWLWKLEREYRTIEWYRFRKTQARPGFIFGGFFFLSGLVFLLTSVWPSFSLGDVILGAVSLVFGAIFIYARSGRSLAYDVKLLPGISRWYTKSK